MSGRLDQSLDSIIDSQKKSKRDSQARRRKPVKAKVGPVGGVKKATKPTKPAVKAPGGNAGQGPATKIVVSGLPFDVNEAQIKEYFGKSVGSVKKVSLQYNQNGQSRGIADIMFSRPGAATKAAKELNGMLVDKRPMKIEVIVDARMMPEPAPAKSLADRVAANPKAQPKSATTTKANTKDAAKGKKVVKGRKGKSSRPKAKTAEELDAEMTDYFGHNNAAAAAEAATTNGAPAAVVTGDDAMDEIS